MPGNSSAISRLRSSLSTSPLTILTLSYSAKVSSSTGSRRLSSSIATTFSASWQSSLVSTPTPGPTSITPTPCPAPLSCAIRGQTVGLMRKFCPSALEKVKPWRERNSLMVPMSDNLFISAFAVLSGICSLICRRRLCRSRSSCRRRRRRYSPLSQAARRSPRREGRL